MYDKYRTVEKWIERITSYKNKELLMQRCCE